MEELEKKYNHSEVERNKYEKWLNKKYFECEPNSKKKPFCIVLPPPNVTGVLHLGHAWDVALQDIIIRYKKMDGYDTFFLFVFFVFLIVTYVKVFILLYDNGIDKYKF